ncbi:hypothetical protein [Faecalimicrobium sp. JNUCC 81]
MEKKDVYIRNIPISTVQKIDIIAKNNGMNRTEFLKKSLEKLVVSDGVSELDSKFSELIKKNIGVLDLNTKALKLFCEENLIDINNLFEN